jgi:hypothetical protein
MSENKLGPMMSADALNQLARQQSMSKGTYIGRAMTPGSAQIATFNPVQVSRGGGGGGGGRDSNSSGGSQLRRQGSMPAASMGSGSKRSGSFNKY